MRSKALALAEGRPDDPIADGETLAYGGRWEPAAAAYTRAFAGRSPVDPLLWFQHVVLRLAAGEAVEYRSACQHMLDRLVKTDGEAWLELAAHAWILAPDGPTATAQALELAERRAFVMPNTWSDHVLGLALYRAGQFAEADRRLRASLERDPGWDLHVLNWLVIAMAQERLGRSAEARHWLERAERWAETRLRGRPGGVDRAVPERWHWRDGILLHLLHREARALIGRRRPDLPADVFARP